MLTKVDEKDQCERLERVSSGEERKMESSRLKSRVVWLYYLGRDDMNANIDKSDCIVIQTEGSEVGKRSVGLVGSKNPADADASAPSPEAGERAEGGGGGGRWLRGGKLSGSRQGYHPIPGKNRQVDLPTGGHTGSIGDGLLSHSL